jgi:hypothetical protein
MGVFVLDSLAKHKLIATLSVWVGSLLLANYLNVYEYEKHFYFFLIFGQKKIFDLNY